MEAPPTVRAPGRSRPMSVISVSTVARCSHALLVDEPILGKKKKQQREILAESESLIPFCDLYCITASSEFHLPVVAKRFLLKHHFSDVFLGLYSNAVPPPPPPHTSVQEQPFI